MAQATGSPRKRPGGRSARVRAAVLAATFEELAAAGYGQFSFERVAERAGVHKTTVYRRWETKEDLILDAMLEHAGARVPTIDTGALRSDLAQLGKELIADLRDPAVRATVRTVASISDCDSPVRQASRRFWDTWLELASEIVDRAIARGEISVAVDPHLVLEAIAGPVHFRLLLSDAPLHDDDAQRLAELVASGATAIQSPRSRSRSSMGG
jgi:AcrR family transcriptional regulator